MQKQGGGKQQGGSKATPSQRGGGNDPSCGCDMQAGWPPASEFPRGGLQGGGWNFNEFNLALTKNGKTRHLRGKWNGNSNVSMITNTNSNVNMNTNTNSNVNMNTNTNSNVNMNTNNTNTNMNMNRNNNNNNKKKTRKTSAPNGYSNLAYKGKKYLKKANSGEVFEISNNGQPGKSMGYYVSPKSGKPYLTQMPPPLETESLEQPVNRLSQPITPPPKTKKTNNFNNEMPPNPEDNAGGSENIEMDAPEGEEKKMKSLSMNGGRRRRHRHTKRRHHKKKGTKRR
jgi:hypothetical protein